MMTYEEASAYITKTDQKGSIYGLDTIRELLNRLGNPQERLKIVHIAGTNGKGSVFAFLDAILEDAGYTVGRYISPAVVTYLERFQLNGKLMTQPEFAELLSTVRQVCEDMIEDGLASPTSFEIETAVAFLYFLKNKADVVLLETGMGGRLDATNVAAAPLCTVLSSISLDHMQFLGNDCSSILKEKMGIMRNGVPCTAYCMDTELKDEWIEKCEKMDCPHEMVSYESLNVKKCTLEGSEFVYKGETYQVQMLGEYQIYNSLLAIETAKMLNRYHSDLFDLKYVNIYQGLKKAVWHGRFEKIEANPPVYVDGAHNEGGWNSLRDNICRYLKGYQIIYLCGVLKDKEYHKMIEILAPYSDTMVAITPENSRALPKEQLIRAAKGKIKNLIPADSAEAGKKIAMEIAMQYTRPVVLVFGSLSFMGPLIRPASAGNEQAVITDGREYADGRNDKN